MAKVYKTSKVDGNSDYLHEPQLSLVAEDPATYVADNETKE